MGPSTPTSGITISVLSDIGCVREVNEDYVHYVRPADPEDRRDKGFLFLVADGVGGRAAGEIASRIAVEAVSRAYYGSDQTGPAALKEAFFAANKAVHDAAIDREVYHGMGTTCTAIVLHDRNAHLAHIGDSRLYLVRDGRLTVMSEDHSLAGEMVRRGLLSEAEARRSSEKHVLLRALGTEPEIEVATWPEPFQVRTGDRFMLCTDGLYDLVQDDEILQIILSNDMDAGCAALIALARERGGYDNITVGLLNVGSEEEH